MSIRPEDLDLINRHVFPAILGADRLNPFDGASTHLAYNEAAVFQALLSSLKPACSIEVGTETGVTLATIARHSTRAISIDIDPMVKAKLQHRIPNAEFITGSSHDVLPELLPRLTAEGVSPDFIFVDGDHTAEGVRKDLEFILDLRPTRKLVVLMHDTFNPGCRQGILAANWARNPHCAFVELDFCPGVLHPDRSCYRQMWGGLGFALFLPEARKHQLEVKRTHQVMFEAAFSQSVYQAAARR